MTVLSISSQKGGVGKTTAAINLSYSFAKRGWKTLLVDTDPQGSVGLSLSRKARQCKGFYDLFLVDDAEVQKRILPTRLPELKILPSGLNPLDITLKEKQVNITKHLERIIEVAKAMDFDLLILDTPAGLFGATVDVLSIVDAVLIPQQAEPLGIRSIPGMLEGLAQLRKEKNKKLKVLGILLTMVQTNQRECVEVIQELGESLPVEMLLPTMVPRDPVFLKASALGVPVSLLYKNPPPAALIFDQIAAEIEDSLAPATSEDNEQQGHTQLMD